MNGNGVRNEPKRTMSDYHLHSTPGMHLSYSMAPPPSSNSHGQHIVRRDSHRSNTRNRISLSRRVSMVTTEGNLVTGNIAGDTLKISQPRKKLILCFDGTGNKFKGNSGDTNILKIFRMLDRSGGEKSTVHYYQPGIGTYITNGTLSRVHVGSRLKSWVNKAMDSAVGTSFDQHVIGGYKFLMRFYAPGDDIYMFGFSRGAYTARFLAEMLDHVGLVAPGNEEMVLFAWKTFSAWQQRQNNTKKTALYEYMRAFRETFARPVRRVRFLGLFDTVNSVPRFEQAWLKRSSGFPYSARSTARVIRHAVGIDERRAKFRQDLIDKIDVAEIARQRTWKAEKRNKKKNRRSSTFRSKLRSISSVASINKMSETTEKAKETSGNVIQTIYGNNMNIESPGGTPEIRSATDSMVSFNILIDLDSDSEDEGGSDQYAPQDIEEVWFPGAHGDIGGGWDLPSDEEPLSHGPLVWMVREARKAGVVFDKQRMIEQNCWIPEYEDDEDDTSLEDTQDFFSQRQTNGLSQANKRNSQGYFNKTSVHPLAQEVAIESAPLRNTEVREGTVKQTIGDDTKERDPPEGAQGRKIPETPQARANSGNQLNVKAHAHPHHHLDLRYILHKRTKKPPPPVFSPKEFLERSYTRGKIHDCLLFDNGIGWAGVLGWKAMEYLPFRRMDLQPDGSWKAIIWPLPCGEVRDIPDNVKIHCSVLKRMQADPNYRPGNLLVGGGGRGVRVAPPDVGIGEWEVLREPGNLIGEVLMKRSAWESQLRRREHEAFFRLNPDLENGDAEKQGHH